MDKTHCSTHPKTQERRGTQLPKASNQEVSALWDCAFFTCRKALLREFYSPVVSRGLKAASNRQQRGGFSWDGDWHGAGRNSFIPSASPSGSEERQRTRMACTTLGSMIYSRPI